MQNTEVSSWSQSWFCENNSGDNDGNWIDFVSCIPVDKGYLLMTPEYCFMVQYTDHMEIYFEADDFSEAEKMSKRSIYHKVDNIADFEQKASGYLKARKWNHNSYLGSFKHMLMERINELSWTHVFK